MPWDWIELPEGDADILHPDVKAVKHIAICQKFWEEYCDRITCTGLNGCDLRIDLREFTSLESVMLVEGGTEDVSGFYTTSGHIEFQDKLFHHICDSDAERWITRVMEQACEEFRETKLSKVEKAKGVPEMKVVEANRIPRIPGDHWERDLGKYHGLPQREEPPTRRRPRFEEV